MNERKEALETRSLVVDKVDLENAKISNLVVRATKIKAEIKARKSQNGVDDDYTKNIKSEFSAINVEIRKRKTYLRGFRDCRDMAILDGRVRNAAINDDIQRQIASNKEKARKKVENLHQTVIAGSAARDAIRKYLMENAPDVADGAMAAGDAAPRHPLTQR